MGEWVRTGSTDLANIYFRNQPQNSTLYLGIYIVDVAPADFESIDFTGIHEPIASAYARIPLVPSNWIVYGGVATYPEVEFEVTLEALGTIYGCFIATTGPKTVDNAGVILAMHQFPSAAILQYYGDRLGITPRMTIT